MLLTQLHLSSEPTGSFNKKTTPRPLYPQTTQRPTTSKPNNFVDQNALDFGDTGDQNIGVEIELPVPDYDGKDIKKIAKQGLTYNFL